MLNLQKRRAIEKFLDRVKEGLQERLWCVYLFGSVAKETAREGSDIDILIVYSDLDERSLLETISEINFHIAVEEGELIQVIPMSKEEYEGSLGHSPFLWEVMKFGLPLFIRSQGTEWQLNFQEYLELAKEYLGYAEDALQRNKTRLAVDTGYNACELLVKALIIGTGNPLASSHGGIVGQFGRVFVLSGKASEHLGRDLHLALELRAKARYRPRVQIEAQDSQFIIDLASELLALAQKELRK